jgi:hypothetical protein
MAAAADGLGFMCTNLSRPGLRISEEGIEEIASEVREVINTNENSIIIFHMYDNNVFFAAGDDRSRSLPVKIGGRYHIPGRLEYADKAVLRNLVNTRMLLLRAGGQCRKYIFSSLLRYLTKPCCDDKLHLTKQGREEEVHQGHGGQDVGYEGRTEGYSIRKAHPGLQSAVSKSPPD